MVESVPPRENLPCVKMGDSNNKSARSRRLIRVFTVRICTLLTSVLKLVICLCPGKAEVWLTQDAYSRVAALFIALNYAVTLTPRHIFTFKIRAPTLF